MLSSDCVDDDTDDAEEAWRPAPAGTGAVLGLVEACALDRPDGRIVEKPFTAVVVDSVQTTASNICIGRYMMQLLLLSTSGDCGQALY
jgi:hypothetical protein